MNTKNTIAINEPVISTNGFSVEYLSGDNTYVVSVYYKDQTGLMVPTVDKFSFSSAPKLRKFIKNVLLPSNDVSSDQENE